MALSSWIAPRKSVCIIAGTRLGRDPAYAEAAGELGTGLAAAGLRLVYGAGDTGLAERAIRAAVEAGGPSLGVVLASATPSEPEEGERPLVLAETLHERKKIMFMNADAIVALPGGAGSLDLIVEVITWRALGLHRKPVFLLNVGGYWDPLIALVDHLVAESFAGPDLRNGLEVHVEVPDLLERLNARLYRRQLTAS